jgi:hypothetical protein
VHNKKWQRYVLGMICAVALLFCNTELCAKPSKGLDKAIISPEMKMVMRSDGKIEFYTLPDCTNSMVNDTALSSDLLVGALGELFDVAKNQICDFKYRPETFSVSAAGIVTGTWRTKDVCK